MAALERFSHSSSLFITELGPMRFYARPGPLKRQLAPLITHGGGIMCRVQEPGAFLLAEPGQVQGIQYMSSSYIFDCVRSNRRLSPRAYRLLNRGAVGPGQSSVAAGAPDRRHRVERKNPSPGKITAVQGVNLRAEGTGEGEARTARNSATHGATPNSIPTAPEPCDPMTSDPSPSAETPALCDPSSSPSGQAPALCSSRPLAPELCDPSSSPSGQAPALCSSRPLAPVLCDLRLTNGACVMKEEAGAGHIAESRGGNLQNSGSIVKPATSDMEMDTTGGHSTVEDRAKEAAEHQAVPGRGGSALTAPSLVGRLPFSREEDIAILHYVRENQAPSRSVTGTLLWKELEKKQLLNRTWQAMKCRYTKYIVRHKHRYRLPQGELVQVTSKTALVESPSSNTNQPGPSSGGTTTGLISQHHDVPHDEKSLKSPHPHEDPLNVTADEDTRSRVCKDLNDDDGNRNGGSTVIQRLRSANRRIVTDVTPKSVQENGESSSEPDEGSRVSVAASRHLPNCQETEDPEDSDDLQIFEIANMEFEVDDEDSGCKVKIPAISLKDFVMGEDSVSVDTQMQVDDVVSSPDLSDSEGLQVTLTDMMNEFKLDICQVTQALLKNNGEVGSTRHFLRLGQRPDGFPIWQHEDDIDLQRNDPVVQAELARKYGADNVAKRAAFLAS